MAFPELAQLKNLDFTKQRTFAYLTCERLYPNFVYFSQKYKFGKPGDLQEAIQYLYAHLFDKAIDITQVNSLINKVEINMPQPADYDTILASSALDACTSIIEALAFLIDVQPPRLENISTVATDTVAMYIHDTNNLDPNTDPNFQQKINSNPLVIKEIAIQKGIISYLSKIDHLQYSDISTLIQLQENNKGSLSLL
jgi:uncharacterized protein YjaG (DUF416 family)